MPSTPSHAWISSAMPGDTVPPTSTTRRNDSTIARSSASARRDTSCVSGARPRTTSSAVGAHASANTARGSDRWSHASQR